MPRLHQAQQTIKREARRFNAIRCGRRFGKDILLEDLLIDPALHGKVVGWFAPIYKDLSDNWRAMTNLLAPVITRANSTEKRIDLIGGGIIDMWSLDQPDSGRGRKYHRIIINEASKIKDLQYSWEYVLRATLADYAGDAFFGGTPQGFNYFSTLCKQSDNDPAWKEFHYTSWDNPFIPRSELEEIQRTYPERVYRQEILAEFVEDGTYFENVGQCAVLDAPDQVEAHRGHYLVMGVDWAKQNDFTVITVGCRDCSMIVDWQRFNELDYHLQRDRLKAMWRKWGVGAILPERNSIGEPNIDELLRDGLPITSGPDDKPGFQMMMTTKPALIEDLHRVMANNEIRIPRDYADELRAFEIQTRKDGRPSFGAPDGMHDDRVISLALVVRLMTSVGNAYSEVVYEQVYSIGQGDY